MIRALAALTVALTLTATPALREWTRDNNRKRQPKPGECGTYSNYTRGCRCDDCKEANRIYRREYYARRKAS